MKRRRAWQLAWRSNSLTRRRAATPRVDERANHRGVSMGGFADHALQGLDDRGRTDFVVVLTDHVFLRRDVRGREQPEDRGAIVPRFRRELEVFRGSGARRTIF